jgi:YD repeat-containing protein
VEYSADSVIQEYSLGEEIAQHFENGELVELGSELGMLVEYERDNRHRVTRITNRLSHAYELGYNGNDDVVWEKNPLGDVAEFVYDDNHNPVSATSHGLTWTYSWNQFNQMTSATNPIGETTVYERDQNGNLTRLIDFSGRVLLQVAYNPDGTIQSITDRYGETFSVQYDEHGNISVVDHPAVGSVALSSSPMGLVKQKASALGEVNLTHDDRAALVELAVRANRKADGDGIRIVFTRDLDNRIVGKIVCGPGECSTQSREFGPTGNLAKSEKNGQTVQDGECPCVDEQGP